jgi:hypothetical protein
MRKTLALAVAAVSAAGVGALVPTAANAAGTGVTFTVSSGAISVAEPAGPASLGTVTSTPLGTTTSGSLGSSTITDNRGSLAGWTLNMASTDFSDGSGHTIAAGKAVAWLPALATVDSGIAVVTNTHVTAATGLALGNAASAFMTATTTGSNVVSYNPSVQVTIDTTAVAATYTATITQTVG